MTPEDVYNAALKAVEDFRQRTGTEPKRIFLDAESFAQIALNARFWTAFAVNGTFLGVDVFRCHHIGLRKETVIEVV